MAKGITGMGLRISWRSFVLKLDAYANNDIEAIVRVNPEANLGAESKELGGVSLASWERMPRTPAKH